MALCGGIGRSEPACCSLAGVPGPQAQNPRPHSASSLWWWERRGQAVCSCPTGSLPGWEGAMVFCGSKRWGSSEILILAISKASDGLPRRLNGKEFTCQCRRHRSDPWVRKIPWRGNGNPLQYSCQRNPMDKRSLRGYRKVAKEKWLSDEKTRRHKKASNCFPVIKLVHWFWFDFYYISQLFRTHWGILQFSLSDEPTALVGKGRQKVKGKEGTTKVPLKEDLPFKRLGEV